MILHEMFEENISIEVGDYLSALIAKIEDYEIYYEEDDEKEVPITSNSEKVRFILNKFIKTGWIDKDYKIGKFIEIIEMKNYSVKILKILYELENTKVQEYNSLIFSTYSSLNQAYSKDKDRMYDALIVAKENTDRLTYELKRLYHSMRDFHKQVSEMDNVNDLLKNHFEEYKSLVDKIYHPIKTMDSFYRYKCPIIEILYDLDLALDLDKEMLNSMCKRAVVVKSYKSNEEAYVQIKNDIEDIKHSYSLISNIVEEIDKRHEAYTRASIEKIRYLMTADFSIKGKLVDILKAYSKAEYGEDNNILEMLNRKIAINRQDNIDLKSLYRKSIRYRKNLLEPIKLVEPYRFDDNKIKNKIRDMKNKISLDKVYKFIKEQLEGKDEIEIKDIEIKSEDEFIFMILAVASANYEDSFYKIINMDKVIHKNGYVLSNVKFIRKGR